MQHQNLGYGLRIESELELPFPAAHAERDPDLRMVLGTTGGEEPVERDGPLRYRLSDARWSFAWDEARFDLIEDRIEIDVRTGEHASVVFRLLGPVLGLWCRRQGDLVLHANVVAREGQALALLGATGAGKTTLTRGLLRRGSTFLSDDLCVLRPAESGWKAHGGPGHLKIRRGDGKVLERVDTTAPGARLAAVVQLEAAGPVVLTTLAPPDALLHLVRHAHMPRSLDVTGLAARHFALSGRLAASVPILRLSRGEGGADQEQSTELLEEVLHTHRQKS